VKKAFEKKSCRHFFFFTPNSYRKIYNFPLSLSQEFAEGARLRVMRASLPVYGADIAKRSRACCGTASRHGLLRGLSDFLFSIFLAIFCT
jgi:hypothetical protein